MSVWQHALGSAAPPTFTARDTYYLHPSPLQGTQAAPIMQVLAVKGLSNTSTWAALHKVQPGPRGGNECKERKEHCGLPHHTPPKGFNSTTMLLCAALSRHCPSRLKQHCPALPKEYSQFLLVATAPSPQLLGDPSGAIPGQVAQVEVKGSSPQQLCLKFVQKKPDSSSLVSRSHSCRKLSHLGVSAAPRS